MFTLDIEEDPPRDPGGGSAPALEASPYSFMSAALARAASPPDFPGCSGAALSDRAGGIDDDPLAWARLPRVGSARRLAPAYTVWQAVRENDLPGLKSLVADGNSVDARNDAGATPLHLCATMGHVCLASFLITAGADVNARDDESHWTPMAVEPGARRWLTEKQLCKGGAPISGPAGGARLQISP